MSGRAGAGLLVADGGVAGTWGWGWGRGRDGQMRGRG